MFENNFDQLGLGCKLGLQIMHAKNCLQIIDAVEPCGEHKKIKFEEKKTEKCKRNKQTRKKK